MLFYFRSRRRSLFQRVASVRRSQIKQIIERLIQESREAYYSTGHPCACPYDHARDRSACGARSAYSRPGGAEPKCYPKDITNADIEAYRTQHGRLRQEALEEGSLVPSDVPDGLTNINGSEIAAQLEV